MHDEVCVLLSTISERAFRLLDYHQRNNNNTFLKEEIDNLSSIQFDVFTLHKKIMGEEDG